MLQTTALGQTGHQFNPVCPLLLRPPWTLYKAQIMWCDSPYELRPCAQRVTQGTGQIVKPDTLTPFARSSTWNRSSRKSNIQREVKTFHEGEQHFSDGQVSPHTPHSHLNLRTVSGGHQIKKRGMTMQKPSINLPPLPERVLKGLKEPWVSPTGEPFHTVSLWEFENLYVLLGYKEWKILSAYLKSISLSQLSRQLEIGVGVLTSIQKNPKQTIGVPNLKKLCQVANLDLSRVEQTIQGVRFNKRGDLEYLNFPFSMDLYTWRILCHIAGDGNVHWRKFPDLRWIQLPHYQKPMRTLLARLSRPIGGKTDQVWYPKALTYAVLGTIPGMTFNDLRSLSFIQFVLNLPSKYRAWKVQFLAAFIIDDGSTSGCINITQKDKQILNLIISLCDQLEYEHSEIYRAKRDGVHSFILRQNGVQSFHYDLSQMSEKDPLLGLWQKHSSLKELESSFSVERKLDQQFSSFICSQVLHILRQESSQTTQQLRDHSELHFYLEGYPDYWFNRRLEMLSRMGLISEILNPQTQSSYRPKHWQLTQSTTIENQVQEFQRRYNYRSHKHSYKRRNITTSMVEKTIQQLEAQGQKASASNVAKVLKCSRKQLYKRTDLRICFVKE